MRGPDALGRARPLRKPCLEPRKPWVHSDGRPEPRRLAAMSRVNSRPDIRGPSESLTATCISLSRGAPNSSLPPEATASAIAPSGDHRSTGGSPASSSCYLEPGVACPPTPKKTQHRPGGRPAVAVPGAVQLGHRAVHAVDAAGCTNGTGRPVATTNWRARKPQPPVRILVSLRRSG